MNIDQNFYICRWKTPKVDETAKFVQVNVKYHYWLPSSQISGHPSKKVLFIAKKHWEDSSCEEEKKSLISKILQPLVVDDIDNLRKELLKLDIGHFYRWESKSSEVEIREFLAGYLNGAFVIYAYNSKMYNIIFRKGSAFSNINIHVKPDGSIHIPNNYPSLAHMVAAEDYNYLKYPIVAGKKQERDKMVAFMKQVWEIQSNESKMNSSQQTLASDLRRLVDEYRPILLIHQEKEQLQKKLGVEFVDLKILMEMTQPFPRSIARIIVRDYMYSFIKSMGHEWGIGKEVELGLDTILSYGSSSNASHAKLAQSIKTYFINSSIKEKSELRKLCPVKRVMMFTSITDSLDKSVMLSTVEDKTLFQAEQVVKDYFEGKPVTIGSGWYKHGIEVTFFNGYIAFTNRGERLPAMANKQTGIEIFKIPDSFLITTSLIFKIMLNEEVLLAANKQSRMEWLESGQGIHKELGIEFHQPLAVIHKSSHKGGNCTWANAKGGFLAELVLMLFMNNLAAKYPQIAAIELAIEMGYNLFKEWEYQHRDHLLDEFIKLKNYLSDPLMPLNKKSYYDLFILLATKVYKKQGSKRKLPQYAAIIRSGFVSKIRDILKSLDFSLDECLGDAGLYSLKKNNEKEENPLGIKLTINGASYQLIPQSNGHGYSYNTHFIQNFKDLLEINFF